MTVLDALVVVGAVLEVGVMVGLVGIGRVVALEEEGWAEARPASPPARTSQR